MHEGVVIRNIQYTTIQQGQVAVKTFDHTTNNHKTRAGNYKKLSTTQRTTTQQGQVTFKIIDYTTYKNKTRAGNYETYRPYNIQPYDKW